MSADSPEEERKALEIAKYGKNMHIRREGTQHQGCGQNYIHSKKNSQSLGKRTRNFIEGENTRPLHAGKLCNENTWSRIRHAVAKVFCKRNAEKQVPYASLTRLDRLSISEAELKEAQKRLRFCLKRTENIYYSREKELHEESDDELDSCFDSVLRERVQRSKSFSTRRMAICKEIERQTKGDRNTSLLELRKTLIINNRFKEMGL